MIASIFIALSPFCLGDITPQMVDHATANSQIVDIFYELWTNAAQRRRFSPLTGESMEKEIDRRLDRMIEICDEVDLTLDEVVRAIGRVDQKTFLAFSDRPSSLPRYMKSKVSP